MKYFLLFLKLQSVSRISILQSLFKVFCLISELISENPTPRSKRIYEKNVDAEE